MPKHFCCCSGGKDSVATVILAHENNEPLDEVVFAEVMFSQNISGELPEHIDFIKNVLFPKFNEWGYKTKILHSGTTYVDMFFHLVTKSKHPEWNNKIMGFPLIRGCYMNGKGKIDAIQHYVKSQDVDSIQYVGIAIDEPERLERDKAKKGHISLLEKYGYTEQMARDKCIEYGLLSPTYQFSKRGGCWFCPNQKNDETRHLKENYPYLWDTLLALENLSTELGVGKDWKTFSKISAHDVDRELQTEQDQIRFEI